jgi:hypothetical protein
LKRLLFRGLFVAGVFAFAALAVLLYRSDSVGVDSYRQASAVALGTDSVGTDYPYSYRVGDRLCNRSTVAALDPGSSLTVYYDPKDPCTSITTSPADKRLGDQAVLAFFTVESRPGSGDLSRQRGSRRR